MHMYETVGDPDSAEVVKGVLIQPGLTQFRAHAHERY